MALALLSLLSLEVVVSVVSSIIRSLICLRSVASCLLFVLFWINPLLSVAADSPNANKVTPAPKPPSNSNSVGVNQISKAAFNATAQSLLPMTSDQIKKLHQLFDESQRASVASPSAPPRPTISSQYVRLEPGVTPTVIRLAHGYVSTLAFLDATGEPWPLDNYDIGNPQAFNIQWDKKSNLLMIQAMSPYNTGNLVVQLRGLSTPVILTLVSGQRAVDYRTDLRIPGVGPNAQPVLGRNLPEAANPALLNLLDGVPPSGGTVLKVSKGLAQAWLLNDHIYVRTRLTIISPAWIATISSPDGMKAYEMPKTPLILTSINGQPAQLKVEGF